MNENTTEVQVQTMLPHMASSKARRTSKVREMYNTLLANETEPEEWRLVPGTNDMLASSWGRVAKVVGFMTGNGYGQVFIQDRIDGMPNSNRKDKRTDFVGYAVMIHHLVARTFLGPCPEGMTMVNHINGNKKDNRVSNLEWCDHSGNMKHAWRTGLRKPSGPRKMKGKGDLVKEMYKTGQYSYSELAREMKCHPNTIRYYVTKWKV